MSVKDRWTLRNIYLYLVCLITLIMVIVAAVGLVRGVVELLYPPVGYGGYAPVERGATQGPTRAEIDRQKREQTRNAVLNLVGSAAMLLVAGPVYLYHWKRIEKDISEEKQAAV